MAAAGKSLLIEFRYETKAPREGSFLFLGMTTSEDYLEFNKKSWDSRVEAHVESDFYDMASFLNGKSSLNEIESALLVDVKEKSILHLQCHFGQDTLSLQRLGSRCVGVDLSEKAIEKARSLNDKLGLD
mgnify:CR=1 FL=1